MIFEKNAYGHTVAQLGGGGAQFTLSPEIERERRTGFLALE